MNPEKTLRVPVRIDFAGGTTDIYPFTHTHGGAVLNAAIDKYIHGKIIRTDKKTGLEYSGNIPTSSGLGTSGAMNVLWLALISKKKEFNNEDKTEISEQVYNIEKTFGGVNGKQDQYAAAFGGINLMEFDKDEVKITPLNLSPSFIKVLESKLLLVYTGEPHISGNSNKSAIDNLIKGKNDENLLRLKNIALEMKNALLNKDLNRFARLLNEETKERKKLHKSTIPPEIEKYIEEGMKNGALAAKVCGSGGGGSILFFGDKNKLKKKFGKKVIEFKFDFSGLKKI
jgi:D-glycero-alpha-D-manno-heptose-7-phosphate kinase